jgi:hypothetical protein
MDIENTGDQQSTRDISNASVETAQLAASALDKLLQKLRQMELDSQKNITIKVGSKNVYQGGLDGQGDRAELTEKQARTLQEAFNPSEISGSIRILDEDNKLLFHSKGGVVIKNELKELQKEGLSESIEPNSEVTASNSAKHQRKDYSQSPDIPSLDDADYTYHQVDIPNQEPTHLIADQEELKEIVHSQAEKIAELQTRLNQVNGRLEELTAWKENLTPVKLANEIVGEWLNNQRNNIAGKVHGLANWIAATTTQKFEQGVERHNQAFDGVRGQVAERITQVRDDIGSRVNESLGQAGQRAAEDLYDKLVSPAGNQLIAQMEKIGKVTVDDNGTKTFQAGDIAWNRLKNGTIIPTRGSGNAITSENATPQEMNEIKETIKLVNEKYGLGQTQEPTLSSQNQTQPVKIAQKV